MNSRKKEAPGSNRTRGNDRSTGTRIQEGTSAGRIYGLIPVIEALRAGQRQIEQITIAEGGKHDRLRELLDLARQKGIPVHRLPRPELDRAVGSSKHQGVVARTAAA